MDIFLHDDKLRDEGFRFNIIAGIDEAGRGPIAGPVVAASVILPHGIRIKGLRDSKLTTENERKTLFFEILNQALGVGVGISEIETIDRKNILGATKLAMQDALNSLPFKPVLVLIDAVKIETNGIPQENLIKGELKSASIAAASIVAKFVRDSIMYELHDRYPVYGFDKHKGYCTEEHMKRLAIHGPCPIHRKSFDKVMTLTLPF